MAVREEVRSSARSKHRFVQGYLVKIQINVCRVHWLFRMFHKEALSAHAGTGIVCKR